MWGPSTGAADPIFPVKKTGDLFSHHCPRVSCQFSSKNWRPFFAHHCRFTRGSGRPFFRHAKISRSFCGGPFLWGPCSAEHAEHAWIRQGLDADRPALYCCVYITHMLCGGLWCRQRAVRVSCAERERYVCKVVVNAMKPSSIAARSRLQSAQLTIALVTSAGHRPVSHHDEYE